MAGHSF